MVEMEVSKKKAFRCMMIQNSFINCDYFTENINAGISGIQFVLTEDFEEAQSLISEGREFDAIAIDLSDDQMKWNDIKFQINILSEQAPLVVLTSERHYCKVSEVLPSGAAGCLIKKTATPGEFHNAILCTEKLSRLQAAKCASELRFKQLFNSYPTMIFICDPETGKFLDVNESAIDQLGYSYKDFLSKKLRDLSSSLRGKALLLREWRSRDENPESITQIKKFKAKNGEILDLQVVFLPFSIGGKDVDMLLATNISSKIKQGRIIEMQNERFDNIAWTQSHIVRAPVARLMALINIFKNGLIEEAERELILDNIYAAAEEVDEIVRGIALASQNAREN
ncbi:MAG: PAS domain S-box protein [Flavobacteriales bacterium]|nr:PAS domain S-box protein [Flavobacteriales bacterium]